MNYFNENQLIFSLREKDPTTRVFKIDDHTMIIIAMNKIWIGPEVAFTNDPDEKPLSTMNIKEIIEHISFKMELMREIHYSLYDFGVNNKQI